MWLKFKNIRPIHQTIDINIPTVINFSVWKKVNGKGHLIREYEQ